MDTFSRDGLTFDVSDDGPADGRVVIALHGFPEDRLCWTGISAQLAAAGYRVLAPDQRGYSPGARPVGRRAYVLEELTADVLALADSVGARRFDVMGHDWGAAVAWTLAARHPDRIRSLTALSVPHTRSFLEAFWHGPQLLRSWYMLAFQIPTVPEAVFARAGSERAAAALIREGLDAEDARRFSTRFTQPGAMTGPINWYRGIPFEITRPTAAITAPTLYVWGDRDRFVTPWAARNCHRFVTGPYRFVELPGMSHFLPTEAAEQVGPMVIEHLAAHTD